MRSGRYAIWAWRGVLLLVLAAVAQAASPALIGTPGARIYVRWAAGVDAPARVSLERQLGLSDGRVHEGATWIYTVGDLSRTHIAAIVKHPSVADTHKIDRQTFALAADTERTPRQGGLIRGDHRVAAALNAIRVLCLVLAAAAFVIAALGGGRVRAPLASRLARLDDIAEHPSRSSAAATRRLLAFLVRGIPPLDARTAGVFRALFGTLLLAYVFLHPVDASWLNPDTVQVTGSLHGVFLDFLGARPWLVDRVWLGTLLAGLAFTIGVWTRWTFAAFVALFLLWVSVFVAHRGSHTSTAMAMALVALLPSRWGDGVSVDAWGRRGRGIDQPAGPRYGYSPWVLSLVFGLCFAGAAWSKVKDGSAWVANGTVAFHFITDSPQALVSWGLWIARSYPLAVTASLIAVLTEALVITATFSRRRWHRAIAGVGALSLLAGFALFQGVVWPLWWILLLGFLPWESIAAARAAAPSLTVWPASRAQAAAVVLLIAQQIVVSAFGIESAPLFSAYDMYSATYASREAFDRTRPTVYKLIDVTGGGERELSCRLDEGFVTEFRKLATEEAVDRTMLAAGLRSCAVPLDAPWRVAVVGDRVEFDWDRGTLETQRTTVVGPVSVSTVAPNAPGTSASRAKQ
jgi:hypothetical protein